MFVYGELVAPGTGDLQENLLKRVPPITGGKPSVHVADEEFMNITDGQNVGDE